MRAYEVRRRLSDSLSKYLPVQGVEELWEFFFSKQISSFIKIYNQKQDVPRLCGRRVSPCFFGGGTIRRRNVVIEYIKYNIHIVKSHLIF